MRRRSPPRLILEIDVGERLAVVVADDKADVQEVDLLCALATISP